MKTYHELANDPEENEEPIGIIQAAVEFKLQTRDSSICSSAEDIQREFERFRDRMVEISKREAAISNSVDGSPVPGDLKGLFGSKSGTVAPRKLSL